MELTERIAALLEEKYTSDEAFQDCFTVDIEFKPANNRLNIYMDADSGITFDKCRIVSRYLEEQIDAQGWLGEKYVLEVSSPGLSRPLRFLRQYRNNLGRQVEISMEDGSSYKGELTGAEEQTVRIKREVTIKEGKKKKKVDEEVSLPFEQITKTIIKPRFK
jgi:ribosome maturation factor RimP